MKLIKLEILNLASLDEKDGEVINFVEGALGESNIFSIVGPTGSGKSTILDAICLALYSRAPRYPRKKNEKSAIEIYGKTDTDESNRLSPTDCRNILTRGKKDGYSKLTFIANNGCLYRAEWHVHFKQKCYDNAVTKLFKITFPNGKPQEENDDWERLPLIIGLDYEQFLRTVLIAQGSFADFLNAKENDRYELLEKLVGCEETYTRIANAIKTKRDDALEAFKAMDASIAADKQFILSDDDLAKLQEEIKKLEEAEKQLTDNMKKVKDELQWYADEEKQTKAIEELQNKLNQATEALAKSKSAIDRLLLHDAIAPAINLLQEVKRLDKEIINLNENITENNSKIKLTEEEKKKELETLEQLNKNAAETQKAIEEKTPHIKKARELKTKIEAATNIHDEKQKAQTSAETDKKHAEAALADNEKQINTAQTTVDAAAQKVKETKETIAKKKEELLKKAENADKALEAKKKEIADWNADELQRHKTLADNALKDLKQAINVVGRLDSTKEEGSRKKARYNVLTKRNEFLAQELGKLHIDQLTKEVETLRKTHTLMTSENWLLHRSSLEEGKACPLCGSKAHPYKQDETSFYEAESELSKLLKDKEIELNKQTETKTTLSNEKSTNEGEINGIVERLQQLRKDYGELETQWEELHKLYPGFTKAKDELEALQTTFEAKQKQADTMLSKYNNTQAEINRLTADKEKADKEHATYEQTSHKLMDNVTKECTDAETKLAQAKALIPNLLQQQEEKQKTLDKASKELQDAENALKELESQYKTELNGEEPDAVEDRLNKAKAEADKTVKEKNEAIKQLDIKLGEIRGDLTSKENQLKTDEANRALKNTELAQWIANYNAKEDRIRDIGMEDVEEMRIATDDWGTLRQVRERLNNAVVSANTLLEKAKETKEEHQKLKPEMTQEELLAKQKELQENSQNDALVAAKAKQKNHDDALLRLGDKADEFTRLTKTKDDWIAITNAIGGDGKTLRKIAQCYTLSFLIEHANAEIRKFNSRYELMQVKNSLGIRVIDHDRADDIRDTTSLSGGETFIVSLGLALGLSALSSRNISFENLFIDEGFGTLDPDTLATVIDSLAMLQSKQGKKVGVISHTDTMSERITTQIRIVKNGNSGSSHIEIGQNWHH